MKGFRILYRYHRMSVSYSRVRVILSGIVTVMHVVSVRFETKICYLLVSEGHRHQSLTL